MKAFKAFIKPFERPQSTLKIKIYLNFFSSSGIGTGRAKGHSTQVQQGSRIKVLKFSSNFYHLLVSMREVFPEKFYDALKPGQNEKSCIFQEMGILKIYVQLFEYFQNLIALPKLKLRNLA